MEAQNNANPGSSDEIQVRQLYKHYLNAWNSRNANGMAELIAKDGNIIGFDGSQMNGQTQVVSELSKIFAEHKTASYVAIVREVRFLSPAVAVLRAVAGMLPPGKFDINPEVNAIQILTAIRQENQWRIAVFQNTPAAFHGRPELIKQLTQELQQVANTKKHPANTES